MIQEAGTILNLHYAPGYRTPLDDPDGDINIACQLTGEFLIEEFQPRDPAAYCNIAGYILSATAAEDIHPRPLYFLPLYQENS